MKTNTVSNRWLPPLRIPLLAAAASLAYSATSFAQTYSGIDLYTLSPPYITFFAAAGQVVGFNNTGPNFQGYAVVWQGPSGAAVSLAPTNLGDTGSSFALATDGTHQVGHNGVHALLWNGTADSAVDLNPTNLSGYERSVAFGVSGTQQVGIGSGSATGYSYHSMLWNGTADSAVDLHPTNLSGFESSYAYGTDGARQVGFADAHAVLWSGTADSAVDLHPTNLVGFDSSLAYGVSGTQQVGHGVGSATSSEFHALLWTGSADSAVDLHPTNLSGFTDSDAYGTNGIHQVGYGDVSNDGRHALLWSDTADSAVDLNALLPFSAISSTAYTIDAQGNVFGVATDSDFNLHAVEWLPVPEPTSLTLAALGILALLVRKGAAGIKQRTLPAVGQSDCF